MNGRAGLHLSPMSTLPFLKCYLTNLVHLAISAAAWAPVFERVTCWQTAVLIFCVLGVVMAPIAAQHDAQTAVSRCPK